MVRRYRDISLDEIEETYFNELYERVTANRCVVRSYRKVCKLLHDFEFVWSIFKDKNRRDDGVKLRNDLGYSDAKEGCSVFEMMVALCVRAEEEIMDDPRIGDRTGTWFFRMLTNLGLNYYDDERYNEDECIDIINRFLDREYESNGKGGLFYIRNTTADLRDIEIWIQMLWYLDTIS